MYKSAGCRSEIVAMSNKLKNTDDTHLAEQHQLLRKGLSKRINRLPNDESRQTTSPDIPYPRNVVVSYINAGEEDQMEVYGYRRSLFRAILTWSFIFATFGILRMVYHWFPEWFLNCTHTRCSLEVAEKVLIVEIYQKKYRRVHIRSITFMSALETINAATDRIAAASKKSDEHRNSHVLQELNRSDDTPTLTLPNADGTFRDATSVRMFTCKKLRYLWNGMTKEFLKVKSLGPGMPTSSLHHADAQQGRAGLSVIEQQRRRAIFGSNIINVPVKSILELLLLEVLNPFYIFQVLSVLIWIMIEYYYFAAAIMIMSAAGIIISIIQTRKNQQKLRNTVHGSDIIDVCRGGGVYETIRTEELVPGDLIILPANGCTMHCDAVLLFGTCIVNESMLTGESVPVTKTPLPFQSDILYHPKEHSRHTLFSGTKVVQTRFYNDEKVMAVVTSTGFMTAKGSLVSAIMYPPPVDFRFERDSYRYIGFLASLASIGFTYSLIKKIISDEMSVKVLFRSFDVITICVPPALPAAMTAGIILAQKRLEQRNIYCISPRSINVSGSLNCICFDKTGTLTEDGLDLWGVVPVVEGPRYIPPLRSPLKLPQALSTLRPHDRSPQTSRFNMKLDPPMLLMGMATCHSLTIIDGNLSGDPLDLKMFESTGWVLVEPSNDDTNKYDNICPTVVSWAPASTGKIESGIFESMDDSVEAAKVEVGIVRQFPFSSTLQRMAILCKRIGQEQLHFFCKGSPEIVQSLCKPDTVPSNHNQILEEYTRQGFRVIALAHRLVEIRSIHKLQKVQREELEHELTFLGLVVLENRLKPDTKAIINQLSDAAVRTVMVTGDNILTAISVARDCEMIGSNDQVVIVSYEESTVVVAEGKPRLTYTLAETSSIQTPTSDNSPSTMHSRDITLDMTHTDLIGSYHLAITGKCWSIIQEHYPELVPRCVVKGTIFARMSPDQKQQLIQALQHLNYVVGMCGDGANDCGALKAAHAGIALSDSEASVASPFTSKDASISCVPELIRQGRCALVTSFGIFKYMAAYSLTQFISVMILYEIGTNLTDFQFLYIDLFLICSLSAVFGRTQPHPGPLFNRPPLTSLLSLPPVGSLLIQVCLVGFFQAISMFILTQQSWFEPYMKLHNVTGTVSGDYASHENYTVFSISMCQYIVLALAYAKGKPFREVFLKNYWFVGALVVSTVFSLYVLIDPDYIIGNWLELKMPPMDFRLIILGLSAAQVFVCLLTEEIVVDRGLVKMMDSAFWLKLRPRKEKYLAIEKEIKKNSDWPPVRNSVDLSSITTSTVAQK